MKLVKINDMNNRWFNLDHLKEITYDEERKCFFFIFIDSPYGIPTFEFENKKNAFEWLHRIEIEIERQDTYVKVKYKDI